MSANSRLWQDAGSPEPMLHGRLYDKYPFLMCWLNLAKEHKKKRKLALFRKWGCSFRKHFFPIESKLFPLRVVPIGRESSMSMSPLKVYPFLLNLAIKILCTICGYRNPISTFTTLWAYSADGKLILFFFFFFFSENRI